MKGFKYIVEIVNEYAKDESLMNGKLEVLYYMLGKKEEVSSQAIERNIRTSFGIMYKDGNQDAVKRYLPFRNRTNGNSLATLYLRLRQEEENENTERAESKNKNRLGILEEDRPNETAKKAFRHKPYQNDFRRRDADKLLEIKA